jgi:hypothetical protein
MRGVPPVQDPRVVPLVGVLAGALVSPWPRRGRSVVYVVAMVATAVLVLVVAPTWDAPGA